MSYIKKRKVRDSLEIHLKRYKGGQGITDDDFPYLLIYFKVTSPTLRKISLHDTERGHRFSFSKFFTSEGSSR